VKPRSTGWLAWLLWLLTVVLVARTLTSTSRSLTAGFSTSTTRTTSGGPYRSRTLPSWGEL
jgi:hypothetical protein